jgi:radical SAM superfamily enzyme YgiQ (UPF0313 family)
MKILCIIPPYIPSYFNAGHHLPVFLVAAYLNHKLPEDKVDSYDCAALNFTWKEVCDLMINKYDIIMMFNDFDAVDTFERFVYYKNRISPETKIFTFGRLSKQIPRFFFQFGIDAVHAHGDFEAAAYSYIQHVKAPTDSNLKGILLSKTDSLTPGDILEPEDWILPDVNSIPYHAYNTMYKNDFNKFCGIPHRQELVLPIARGCPVGCSFCDVPVMQGNFERRLSVERTIEYIKNAFESLPFEYVTFYAPTFTLNKKWVKSFCYQLSNLKANYPWKCVTVLKLLNEELIELMSQSGCVRISLGIESFTNSAAKKLPKLKQDTLNTFIQISESCKKNNIELNCFIMLGIPEDTPEDVANTIDICLKQGARVRPTIFTSYHHMHEHMTVSEVNRYNRQLFPTGELPEKIVNEYYNIFYNNISDKKTQVMKNIPRSVESQTETST